MIRLPPPENLNLPEHFCPFYDNGKLYINDVKRNLVPVFGGCFDSGDSASVYTSCWNFHRAYRNVNLGFRLSVNGLTCQELLMFANANVNANANANVDLPD